MTLEGARAQVASEVPPSNNEPPGEIPLSPRARGTLEGAPRQAMGLKSDVVGTEHLLLALLIERDSRTASVLTLLGCPPDLLRTTVLEQRAAPKAAEAARPGARPRARRARPRGRPGARREHARRRRPDARAGRPLGDADARADRARRHPAGAPRRDPASARRVTRAHARRYLPDAAPPSSRAALPRDPPGGRGGRRLVRDGGRGAARPRRLPHHAADAHARAVPAAGRRPRRTRSTSRASSSRATCGSSRPTTGSAASTTASSASRRSRSRA